MTDNLEDLIDRLNYYADGLDAMAVRVTPNQSFLTVDAMREAAAALKAQRTEVAEANAYRMGADAELKRLRGVAVQLGRERDADRAVIAEVQAWADSQQVDHSQHHHDVTSEFIPVTWKSREARDVASILSHDYDGNIK